MDILLIYLFKLYLCECFELVSDASCNMKETPPSLIQLYCFLFFSFFFFLAVCFRMLGFCGQKDLFGNMQDMLGKRMKLECTVKYFFPLLKCQMI